MTTFLIAAIVLAFLTGVVSFDFLGEILVHLVSMVLIAGIIVFLWLTFQITL